MPDRDRPTVSVGVLGSLIIEVAGAPVEVAGGRLRALLCRLAVEPGRRVSAAELSAAVWPDDPPAEPVNALQTLVSRLRRALGSAALVSQEQNGYRLALAPDDLDATRFSRLVAGARREADPAEADRALVGALELWRGEPLADGGSGDYVTAYAARWSEERLSALKQRSAIALTRGGGAELVGDLEELLAEHPLDESLLLLLLQSLAAGGRVSEALARYEQFRVFLADTLGSDPGRDLQAQHLTLLRDVSAEPAPPTRSNLRSFLTSFVGRDTDVARVLTSVRAQRLTTVVGPGGTGKTRLAIEVARQWQAEARGPAWLVELAPVTEAANVPVAFLGAMGRQDARITERAERLAQDDTDRLLDVLRSSTCLLVVDNCEHLIEASATIVDLILAEAPGVRVLTTSREPLALIGEAISALSPLEQPAADAAVETAAESAAVRLWLDRARAVQPDFALDAGNRAAVIDIVRRLDGLPLAIELAAARLRVLPVAEIAVRLSDRFRLLTGGNRAGLPRHRTLRAVVEWSWDLLSPAERLLAERLAVFPAGADSAAATAICADDRLPDAEIDALLLALVDKSLLQAGQPADADRVRFRMLETIREYGIERLAEHGELATARLAHARYYAELAEQLEPVLRSGDQLAALRTLRLDRENVLSAIRFLGDSGRTAAALRVALALAWYWVLIGSNTEAVTWLSYVVELNAGQDSIELTYARASLALTQVDADESSGPDSRMLSPDGLAPLADLAEELLAIPRAPYPGLEVAGPMLAHLAHRPDLAERLVERAMTSDDRWVRAAQQATIAFVAENGSDVETMRASVDLGLAEFSEIGDRWGLASCLLIRGRLRTLDGRLDEAMIDYEQAWSLLRELGQSSADEMYIRIRTADLYARAGDIDEARRRLGPVTADQAGDRAMFITAAMLNLDRLAGDLPSARLRADQLRQQIEIWPRDGVMPFHHLTSIAYGSTGALAAEAGDLETARADLVIAYHAGVASTDMPILAALGTAVTELALALDRPAMAATILGATAQINGIDDFGDPVVKRLDRRLRAALGDDYSPAYAAGRDLDRPAAIARLNPELLTLRPDPGASD